MATTPLPYQGLTSAEVQAARAAYGTNTLTSRKRGWLRQALLSISGEPMFLLLLTAAVIYLVSGREGDALFMAGAIVLIVVISLYQEARSRNALEKLQQYAQPHSKVLRDGKEIAVASSELVVGDLAVLEEGGRVPADGVILLANDFSVDQSVLTGESLPVFKNETGADKTVYSGTTIATGRAVAKVTAVGDRSELGKIKTSLETIREEKTPLEHQVKRFVGSMVIAGSSFFLLVWGISFYRSRLLLDSLLKALTLAMSILPEEIPVAFTAFMALGAMRLMRTGVIVKQTKTVEALGSADIICIDKTGTITQNKMQLAKIYLPGNDIVADCTLPEKKMSPEARELIRIAMFASEPVPFDPMEIALHQAYASSSAVDERAEYSMVKEYPLGGTPPMMTHIFEDGKGHRVIAAKGAPEALYPVTGLSAEQQARVHMAFTDLASQGYRVLAVAQCTAEIGKFPDKQQDLRFALKGLVAFYDPPKDNIAAVFKAFYDAGISVKILTGDNALTTAVIARQTGFRGWEQPINGEDLLKLNDTQLLKAVREHNVFSRMFPEAKVRAIEALKAGGSIVAMTGDGVNDAPALKAAHIGIAMGKKGTALARDTASLILVDDDLSQMVGAVADGRRIYENLKRAIGYIIAIHIPIILMVFLPLAFNWQYPEVLLPAHVVLLELVMGPTCSIAFENEPAAPDAMKPPPRRFATTFFNARELGDSLLAGLSVTAALVFVYHYAIYNHYSPDLTRTVVFSALVLSNIDLTLAGRASAHWLQFRERQTNKIFGYIIAATLLLLALLLLVPGLRQLLRFEAITAPQLLLCALAACTSVALPAIIRMIARYLK